MRSGPFMEFISWNISGAVDQGNATWAMDTIKLPVSGTELLALLIHSIHIETGHVSLELYKAGGEYRQIASLSLRKPAYGEVVERFDPAGLAFINHCVVMVETALSNFGYMARPTVEYKTFDPPILIAQSEIYVSGEVRSTVAQDQQMACSGRIGYTLEKVSKDDFIAALVRFAG